MIVAVAMTLLLAAAAGAWFAWGQPTQSIEQLMADARADFQAGEYAGAEELAKQVLARDPQKMAAVVIAAQSAARARRFQQALDYLKMLESDNLEIQLRAALMEARIEHKELFHFSAAEAAYRRALKIAPNHIGANEGLARLLGVCAQRYGAIPHILRLIRLENASDILMLLAKNSTIIKNKPLLEKAHHAAPHDPNPLIGLAWHALNAGGQQKAIALLREALRHQPDHPAAVAALGQALWKARQFEELAQWARKLPPEARALPGVWHVLGEMAARRDQPRAALRCYAEAARLAPDSKTIMFQLARLMATEGDKTLAAQCAEQLGRLQELNEMQNRVLFAAHHESTDPVYELIAEYEEAGRLWEAYGWAQLAATFDRGHSRAKPVLLHTHKITQGLPLVLIPPARNVAFDIDLKRYPLPKFSRPADTASRQKPETAGISVSFRNDANAAGLGFRYFHGTEGTFTRRMYEFTGGGIGVLDYDADGLPDLYFTQGRRWPPEAPDEIHRDALFRNIEGRRFIKIAQEAGLNESGFGQGITVGDFDADGFDDIYIANIGRNRLLRNNGDGTFTDVTQPSGLHGRQWTTSCVMADLNGDRLPDIYDANYLTGDDIYERLCRHPNGDPKLCMPFDFNGQPDCLWINRGDGTFREATDEVFVEPPVGKGLGIMAWDPFGDGQLSLFVANDTSPCFFLTPVDTTETTKDSFTMVDRGIASGLALNGIGKATGAMGVAIADINHDQRMDLFVTNFYAEPNTLHVSTGPGLYEDRTAAYGLRDVSIPQLGFGTHFLDANLDGKWELFVANGHVDDLRRSGRPYRMPAQFFTLVGSRFVQLDAEAIGPYFEKKWLGRAAVRLDWNADGKTDLAVGHLAAPYALLTNTTKQTGHFVALELVGTKSPRMAIGTKIEVRLAQTKKTYQLTAGSGYQASNQRRVVIGLGQADAIDELTVHWPSQSVQHFTNVTADTEYILKEGDRLLASPPLAE